MLSIFTRERRWSGQVRTKSSIYPTHFGLGLGAKPSRRWPRRRRSASWDGFCGSEKTQGPAPFESLLERDFQTHLNADPTIKEYAVQPHRLIYWAPDETGQMLKRSYTPDVAARTQADRVLVFEVKAKVFAEEPRWRRLEPCIRDAYESDHGVSFIVLTEDEIRAQPRLMNCEVMLRHRKPGDDHLGELIVRHLVHACSAELTIATILEAASKREIDERRAFSALMRMALSGEIRLDLSRPLSPHTAIRVETQMRVEGHRSSRASSQITADASLHADFASGEINDAGAI